MFSSFRWKQQDLMQQFGNQMWLWTGLQKAKAKQKTLVASRNRPQGRGQRKWLGRSQVKILLQQPLNKPYLDWDHGGLLPFIFLLWLSAWDTTLIIFFKWESQGRSVTMLPHSSCGLNESCYGCFGTELPDRKHGIFFLWHTGEKKKSGKKKCFGCLNWM